MRVSCPACDAAYEIPNDVLAVGARRLRCARCANEWTVEEVVTPVPSEPPAPDPAVEPVAEIEPVEPSRPPPPLVASPPLMQQRPDTDDPPPRAASVIAGWVVSVAILAGLGTAAYLFRDAVQSAWPPSQVLYAALGLRQ